MRVALLTTETPHHLYYAWRLKEAGVLQAIVMQTTGTSFPFETTHPFEEDRDRSEREMLLAGGPSCLHELAPVTECENPNDPAAVAALRQAEPDLVVVFGTGIVGSEVAAVARRACLNLHGGNPEIYRGLDSHLWAIYHRDYVNLTTTLHAIAPELDTGDIVMEARVPLATGMPLSALRGANTRVCVDLTLAAVYTLSAGSPLPVRPQRQKGRYYSAMPAVLKDVCVRTFARYTAGL